MVFQKWQHRIRMLYYQFKYLSVASPNENQKWNAIILCSSEAVYSFFKCLERGFHFHILNFQIQICQCFRKEMQFKYTELQMDDFTNLIFY